MTVSIVILAAGSSSRMGQSKQLLPIGNELMLRSSIKKAQSSQADDCVVVLGSNEHAHLDAIIDMNVHVAVNVHWERGMGSSLKAGLKYLTNGDSKPDAILVMLIDQPAVTATHLNVIIDTYHKTHSRVVAAEYAGEPGVPALIDSSLFPEVMELDDSSGAKTLLSRHRQRASFIAMPEAAIDIDTPEDYERYKLSH
jgi:molybdenum cofactor cytidylyltransferase